MGTFIQVAQLLVQAKSLLVASLGFKARLVMTEINWLMSTNTELLQLALLPE